MKPLRTEDLNNILHTNSVTRESYLGTFPACVFPRTDKKCTHLYPILPII